MYEVSEDYYNQTKRRVQCFCLKGKIGSHDITEDNILEGSLCITNQCSDSKEVTIGSVYIGELKATVIGVDIQNWKDVIVSVKEGLLLEKNNTWEYVQLGSGPYTVSEANKTEKGMVITAYDNMAKFDKPFGISSLTGSVFELLSFACSECGVELALAKEEVEALVNGTKILTMYANNDIETYRDFVSWLAQTCCSFATINRDGKLILKMYGQDKVDSFDKKQRYTGGSYSNFETRYSGISVVNMSDDTTSYYKVDPDEYLTYNLGSNPFLQQGIQEERDNIRISILKGLQNIKYAPFKMKLLNGAIYDLGDVVVFPEGIGDASKKCCIMNYNYIFNKEYKIEGYGKNPNLATARSKTDKKLAGIAAKQTTNELQYYTFTNANEIDIADGKNKDIIDIRFTSAKAGFVIFQAEILLDVETTDTDDNYSDAVGTISYIINESELLGYNPTETWVDGKHILSLFYVYMMPENTLTHWVVNLDMSGGSVYISETNIRASVYGQGLAASDEWSGFIDINEAVPNIVIDDVFVDEYKTKLSSVLHDTYKNISYENVTEVNVPEVIVDNITDTLISRFTYTAIVNSENEPIYDTSSVYIDSDIFKVSGETPQDLFATLINTDKSISYIGNLSMELTNCTFQFSAGDDVWKSFENGEWIVTTQAMVANSVLKITSEQWLGLVAVGKLDVKITMTDANSTVTYFELEYMEDVA